MARLELVVFRPRYDIRDVEFARCPHGVSEKSLTIHNLSLRSGDLFVAFNSQPPLSRQAMASFCNYIARTGNLREYVLIYIHVLTQLISTFASFVLAWCDERTPSQRSRPSQSRVSAAYDTKRPVSITLPPCNSHINQEDKISIPHVIQLRSSCLLCLPLHQVDIFNRWTIQLKPHLNPNPGKLIS